MSENNNPDDITWVTSAWAGDKKFVMERLHYNLEVWILKDMRAYQAGRV